MSDYHNFNDPMGREPYYDPDVRRGGAAWGWIAAALFIVVVLVVAFGARHGPSRTALNETAPPPASRMAPGIAHPSPANPGNPAPLGNTMH